MKDRRLSLRMRNKTNRATFTTAPQYGTEILATAIR
jgi:hypothetical protein